MPAIPQTLPFARQKRGEELQRKAIMLLRDLSKAQDSTSKLLLARDLEKTKAALRSMGSGNTNAIIQGAASGTTLGFSDELGAGVRAAVEPTIASFAASPLSGAGRRQYKENYFAPTFGERYRGALASQRGAQRQGRQDAPGQTLAAELAGGLLTGGVGGVRAAAGKTIAPALGRLSMTGAAFGAGAGYGFSEGDPLATAMIGDKPLPPELREAGKSTAVGAAFGGAVGAGLPALASGVRAVVRNVPFVVRPFTRQARINEAGRKQIAASLERDVDIFVDELVGDRPPTPKDFDVIRKQLQKEMDTYGLTVGDLGPNLRGLVEDIAQTGTVQGNRMRRFLSTRATGVMVDGVNQGGQYSRVVPKLSKLLGMGGADSQFHRNLIQMQVAAKKVAKADFDRAYFNADGTTRRVVMTPEMHRILEKTPLGREARELAEVIAENNGRKLPAYGGVGGKEPTEVMHVLMQGMDDVVSKKWRVERGAVARSYDDQFKKFVADVRRQNPELAKAQSRWATEKKAEEALQAGRSIFKKDFDLVETQLAKMQENELTHFRIGVLREIEKRIGSKRDAIDLTKDLLDKREIREALRIAFGDEAKFRKVMRLLEAEAKMHETYHAAVGNSKTALRLSRATIDMGEKLATLAGYGSTLGMGSGVPPSFGGFLARKLYQAIGGPQRASRTVNDILQNQNTILQGGSLNAATQPQTTLAGLLNTGAPAPASALAGALAATGTGQPQ